MIALTRATSDVAFFRFSLFCFVWFCFSFYIKAIRLLFIDFKVSINYWPYYTHAQAHDQFLQAATLSFLLSLTINVYRAFMKESKIRILLSFHKSNLSLKYTKSHAALGMLIRSFCNHLTVFRAV